MSICAEEPAFGFITQRSTFAEMAPVAVRTGVAAEDGLKRLFDEMSRTAGDEKVLIAHACLPGVVAFK